MSALNDSIMIELVAIKPQFVSAEISDNLMYVGGCGCTGNCGQSCRGGCEAGCSGNCGRSCYGSMS